MKRTVSLILTVLMVISMAACGDRGEKGTSGDELDFTSYPIETEETLTYWMELPGNNVSLVTNLADTPFAQKLMEETGVNIEFIHPAAGQVENAFGLLLASNDLPDMIEYKWGNFSGGPTKAINEEVIEPLNDYMEHAPNLKAFLAKDESYDRSARTDEGQYYMFPFVCDGKSLLITSGPVLRKDWLDELGLDVPETYEEWTNVLTAFKEKKGATAPFTVFDALSYLIAFFDGQFSFYVDGDTIKYGPAEPAFKAAIEGLEGWFSKGLLDENFVSLDKKGFDSNMLTGKSGAALASGGSGIGQWLAAKPTESYDLVGASYLSLTPGKPNSSVPAILPFQPKGVAITSSCKNIPLAMRFLDYGYSEEGHMLYNFGIEGESYVMVDGTPTYTDVIYNNENGYTPAQAMSMYFRAASGGGASAQDPRYLEGYYNLQQQQEALKIWRKDLDLSLPKLVPAVFPTQEESTEAAVILTELEKYVKEMAVRFITGVEPMSNYDKYLERLDELKLDRAIELKQAAYDRYLQR